MNFDEAIKAHAAWKMKLQSYISVVGAIRAMRGKIK